MYFTCSNCGSIYRFSSSKGWIRLNVDPATDTSAYPEVTLIAKPPYCDCELKEYLESMFRRYGPEYCSVHNVIVVGGIFDTKNPPENIDEIAQYTLMHETLHWVLGNFVCEQASFWLDNESVTKFIDDYYFDDKKVTE